VIATDGLLGFFTRGLGTRILTNALQSIMFSILWKLFMDMCVFIRDFPLFSQMALTGAGSLVAGGIPQRSKDR
jgi:hypothetical protein